MKYLLLLLALLSFNLHAQEESCEHHAHRHDQLEDLLAIGDHLDWFAATTEQIKNAHCMRKEPFTEAEMKDWLTKNQSATNKSRTVNGIKFENESEENLRSFAMLMKEIGDNFMDLPPRNYTSNCTKVECAVKEILGKDIGLPLLYMHRRYGMNGSHLHGRGRADPWKKEELDTVLLSLSDFPEGIMPFEDDRSLIHAKRGSGNGRTYANAIILVYDLWSELSPEQMRSTITHELGHALAGVTDIDNADHWKKLGGWSTKTTIGSDGKPIEYAYTNKPESMISEYAQTNSWEDFAEAVVAYRYNPKGLKEVSPAKYDLVKKIIFDGVEYTSQEACSNPKRISEALKKKVEAKVASWLPSSTELRNIGNLCTPQAIKALAEEGRVVTSNADFQECYEKAIGAYSVEFLKAELTSDPDAAFMGPVLRNSRVPISAEKVKGIAAMVQRSHLENLRHQIKEGLNDNYACDKDFIKYAYQRVDENALGIRAYDQREEFHKIFVKACESASTKTGRGAQVDMMIK